MPGFHSYNHGVVTPCKGYVTAAFIVAIGATGAPGTVDELSANLIASVTRNSAGLYTVQLNKPYPPRLVYCQPSVAVAGGTTALDGSYVRNSYSATNGTFQFVISENDGTPAAVDPANGDAVMVNLVFGRYTRT